MQTVTRRLLALALVLAPATAGASFINYSAKEINIKVVYFGPGSGLSENLKYVYGKTSPEAKGKLIELAAEDGKVQFFDFLPLKLGEIRGFKTRFHLYTVPTGDDYSASRKLILKGVDGVVFVADARDVKASQRSFKALQKNLAAQGYDWKTLPLVLQVVGTNAPKALSLDQMARRLGFGDRPKFAASPADGPGVFDTLKAIAKLTLLELKKGA